MEANIPVFFGLFLIKSGCYVLLKNSSVLCSPTVFTEIYYQMKSSANFRQLTLKRYDKLIRVLLALLLGLSISACEDPDDPQPEYGVQPMYGVQTVVNND